SKKWQGGNGMTLPISYFRFYFPEYVLKTRLPPNCATGFLDSLRGHAEHGPFSWREKRRKTKNGSRPEGKAAPQAVSFLRMA
ncbi:hypothetical protein, partial [Dysosmobacter sp. HCP28S3_G4]|uniref:hypothetical protein n=1 Tax=Dysosmobacter sp. HCP28S3_G4 TaxID=3438938 RepID=UPI003F8AAFB9